MNKDQLTIENEDLKSSADKEKVGEDNQPFPTWPIVFFVFCMVVLDNGVGKAFLDPILDPSVRVSTTGFFISKPLGILGCFLLAYFVSKKKPKAVLFGEAKVLNRLPFIDSLLLLVAFVPLSCLISSFKSAMNEILNSHSNRSLEFRMRSFQEYAVKNKALSVP